MTPPDAGERPARGAGSAGAARPRLSVIVPALDEAPRLPAALARAQQAPGVEVIVVDGGSRDDSARVARAAGARVLRSPPGRAVQMNRGARAAHGELLLFLHADTLLPGGWDADVRAALARPDVAAGAFELRIDGGAPLLRWVERAARWRSRRLGMPYGDQALFVRADLFWRVGGYAELPLLEDLDLVRRLRGAGRIITVPAAVVTSARYWERRGILRGTLLNQAVLLGHWLGIAPARLARWRRGSAPAPSMTLALPFREDPS